MVSTMLILAAPAFAAATVRPSTTAVPEGWSTRGEARDEAVNLVAEYATRGGSAFEAGGTGGPATEKFFRATPEQCEIFNGLDADTDLSRGCGQARRLVQAGIECAADSYYLGALYRQTRTIDADGVPGAWSPAGDPVVDQSCVTPADLTTEAERALATLTISPSPVSVQPPDGWTLVNIPTITHTTDDPQDLATTLLGIPVTLRVDPDTFAWDYDDATPPLVTTDPGAPYPDHTVHHTYTQPADQVTITLTTTWTARFRITGAPTWTPVTGTATTTSTADPLRVYEARSRLVTDNLPD
jgi:hypothetical protein